MLRTLQSAITFVTWLRRDIHKVEYGVFHTGTTFVSPGDKVVLGMRVSVSPTEYATKQLHPRISLVGEESSALHPLLRSRTTITLQCVVRQVNVMTDYVRLYSR